MWTIFLLVTFATLPSTTYSTFVEKIYHRVVPENVTKVFGTCETGKPDQTRMDCAFLCMRDAHPNCGGFGYNLELQMCYLCPHKTPDVPVEATNTGMTYYSSMYLPSINHIKAFYKVVQFLESPQ